MAISKGARAARQANYEDQYRMQELEIQRLQLEQMRMEAEARRQQLPQSQTYQWPSGLNTTQQLAIRTSEASLPSTSETYDSIADDWLRLIPDGWIAAQKNGVDKVTYWQSQADSIHTSDSFKGLPVDLQLLIRSKFLAMCSKHTGMDC